MAGAADMADNVDNYVLRACVDIGSTPTRLLVVEPRPEGLREVLAQRCFTRLGRATGPDGAITADKVAEIAEIVAGQVQAAQQPGCGRLRVVAPAAIRRAANRDELVAAVEARAGVGVDVLTVEQEARYAFAGATAWIDPPPPGSIGVVDVGGGSSELPGRTGAGGARGSPPVPLGPGGPRR